MNKYISIILLLFAPLIMWAQCASPMQFQQNNETIVIVGPSTGMALSVQLSKSDYNGFGVSCNGSSNGWVTATSMGGSPPYSYAWSNGVNGSAFSTINGLSIGTYGVTVTDVSGCTAGTTPAVLTEPTLLMCSSSITNPTCNGFNNGSISIASMGGVPPYIYSINGPGGTQTSMIPSFSNLAQGTYTLTTEDANACTCSDILILDDNIPPIAYCKTVMVQLNASGNGTALAADVNNNSTDNCGIANLALNQTTFTCSTIGANTVTLTVTDTNNNTATCSTTITVQDNVAPIAICQPVAVQLSAGGTASITAAQVNNNSSDNCGIATYTVFPNNFTCSNIGNTTTVLTVTDVNGNAATCSTTITVQDNVAPTAVCKNATVALNLLGMGSISTAQINNGSADNCSAVTLSLNQTNFSCANVGSNTVTLTVTDAGGGTATCSATVMVQDNLSPTVVCQSATLVLNTSGTATLTTAQINNGSSDNCGIVSQTLSKTNFTCADVGSNSVIMTASDASGNTSYCVATVNVTDNIAPTAVCQNITVQLGPGGTVSITPAQVNNGSTDNCGAANLVSVLPNSFNCFNTGANTVTLKVNDSGGNTSTCSAIVTVQDVVAPSAICKNATVTLSAGGMASVTSAQINNGSNDNCGGTVSTSLNVSSFTCANIGANTVILTASDAGGNTSTCSATVTVADNIAPTAVCQNISVTLSGGTASITPAQINNGSTDNCGTVNLVSVSPSTFTCSSAANTTVTLTVNDGHGNSASCTAIVSVGSVAAATAANNGPVCVGGTINLSAAAGISYNWSGPSGYTSTAQNPIRTGATLAMAGNYMVTVTNSSGCTASAYTTVTVSGTATASISGNAGYCMGGTISLSASGGTSFVWSGPAGFTSTNASITLFPATTTMAGIYTVTVSSGGGCTASASKTITVTATPVASVTGSSSLCAGQTISLTAMGGATYVWLGPDGYTGSGSSITRSAATTAMSGVYNVTVTNTNGCTATANRTVTVNAIPVATAGSNSPACVGSTINLSASGGVSYQWSGPNLFNATTQNPIRTGAAVSMAGTYIVTVTAAGGCTASASTVVAVSAAPAASVSGSSSLCAGNTLTLTASGGGSYEWSGPGFTGTGSLVSIPNASTAATGVYTVTVTGTSGCTATASKTVTVNATPVATAGNNGPVCTGASLVLSASGGSSYSWSGPGGFVSTTQNPVRSAVLQTMAGTYTVTVTNTSGCSATASTEVTVNVCGSALTIVSSSITSNSSATAVGNGAITLNVAGGVPCAPPAFYTYSWSPATGTMTSSGGTHIYSALNTGWYIVTINDCGGNSITQYFYVPKTNRGFGFKTAEPEFGDLTAAPNPTGGQTTVSFISFTKERVRLSVYSVDGKEVGVLYDDIAEENAIYELEFDMKDLTQGTYYAVLRNQSGERKQLRLLVVR